MIPFFVKVDTAPCEWFSATRRPDGKVGVAIQSDGSVGDTTLTLEQMRQVLALFPELTQEARNAALEEAAKACETAAVPLNLDEWMGTKHNLTRATADSLAKHIRALVKP